MRQVARVRRWVLRVALLSLAACGGTIEDQAAHDAGGDVTRDSPAAADATVEMDAVPERDSAGLDSIMRDESVSVHPDAGSGWSPVCPAAPPSIGAPCLLANVSCEYACGQLFTCFDSRWGGGCDVPYCPGASNPPDCPPGMPMADVGGCTASGLCSYPTGVCSCTDPYLGLGSDAGPTWWCGPQPGCPVSRPRIGAACEIAGQRCNYAQIGAGEICRCGFWQDDNCVFVDACDGG